MSCSAPSIRCSSGRRKVRSPSWGIATLSGGIPRQINRVCDLGLLAGATEELTQITEPLVESVYKELNPDSTEILSIAV